MLAESGPVTAKICGLTRAGDAALAVEHGAARLGVVFAGGPRSVRVSQAREIVAAAGAIPVLAVVRAISIEELRQLVSATGVKGVQLHGPAPDTLAHALAADGVEVWRQVALRPGDPVAEMVRAASPHADAIIVEARDAFGQSGGRGQVLAEEVARLARQALAGARMVLAGGLTPDSVGAAIRRVRPDLVDVSSGVESAPGIKDPARLVRFLEEVRDLRSPN